MGPNAFQSSFIPKGSGGGVISESGFPKKKAGIFGTLAITLFILVLLVTAGLFAYNWMLKSGIESLKTELAMTESGIDTKPIDTMFAFSKKLATAREVVMRHRVVSNSLALLSAHTIQNVSFSDFSYQFLPDGQLSIILSGNAPDYASIALQEKELKDLKEIKSTEFSGLTLTDKGRASFKLFMFIDPAFSVYTPPEISPTIDDTNIVTDDLDITSDLDLSIPDLDNF